MSAMCRERNVSKGWKTDIAKLFALWQNPRSLAAICEREGAGGMSGGTGWIAAAVSAQSQRRRTPSELRLDALVLLVMALIGTAIGIFYWTYLK